MAGLVLNSSSVLRLNLCAKLKICAPISATSQSPETLAASVKDDPTTTNRRLKTRKKQTILIGEHRHKNDTTNGQGVSRHSLPTLLCFNFFSTAQNILNCHRTNGTFGFSPPTSRPFSKTKRAIFCPRTKKNDNFTN